MSYALFINQGLLELAFSLGQWRNLALEVGLFTNFFSPSPADSNLTPHECALPGYARVALNSLSWEDASVGNDGSIFSVGPSFTFGSNTGGIVVYGFVLYSSSTEDVIAEGLLDSAYSVPASGGTLTFALQIVAFAQQGPFV